MHIWAIPASTGPGAKKGVKKGQKRAKNDPFLVIFGTPFLTPLAIMGPYRISKGPIVGIFGPHRLLPSGGCKKGVFGPKKVLFFDQKLLTNLGGPSYIKWGDFHDRFWTPLRIAIPPKIDPKTEKSH